MLKAIIIDDVALARLDIKTQLNLFAKHIEVIAEANSVSNAVTAIEKHKPDVIFLDIELGNGTGFDVLSRIDYRNFKIIFITAYNQHAVRAFKFSAIDYILKPVQETELIEAIDKLQEAVDKDSIEIKYKSLLTNFKTLNKTPETIILKTIGATHNIIIADIFRIEAKANYAKFYLKDNKKIMVSYPLKNYISLLSEYRFFRPHQSHFINLNYVVSIKKHKNSWFVELNDGSIIPLVEDRKKSFEEALTKM